MFLMRTLLTLMVPEYLIWPQRQTPAGRATKGGGGWEVVQGVGKLAKKAAESHIKHTGKASGGRGRGR